MIAPQGLSADQQMEYQEIGEFARHDDIVHLTMSSVLLPVLAATLGYAWQNRVAAIPLAFASFTVWLYWFSVKKRRMDFLELRLRRARELEEIAGLYHHRLIHWADVALTLDATTWVRGHRVKSFLNHRLPALRSLARIKRVERLVSVALVLAWLPLFVPVMPGWLPGAIILLIALLALAADIVDSRKRKVMM
jgi:hypothetical protein